MTFSVNGIKQEKNEKTTIEMLICVNDALLARKILEDHNILILSLKDFSEDPKSFGDIYFSINQNFQKIDIVTKYTDIQKASSFFSFMGFAITDINSFAQPLPQKERELIIKNAQTEAASKQADVWKAIIEKETQERKVYEDAHLESAKKIIVRVFEKVDDIQKKTAGQSSLQDKKQHTAFVEELKKLRMGTNFEKIRETIESIFVLLEKLNTQYYASIQTSTTISSESLVTPVDVEREIERMENIKILKTLGAHISLKNQDYATFGSSAIFRKFLQKDFLLKIADLPSLVYRLFDITEFVLIVVIALLGIYTLGNDIYLFSPNQFGLSYSMITVGIRGIIVFAARYFRKKSVGRLLLILLIAIVLHYLLMRMVTTNFAL